MQQYGQQTTQPADLLPGFRKQGIENGLLFVRTAAPENDYRHDLYVGEAIGQGLVHEIGHQLRRRVAFPRCGHEGLPAVKEKKGVRRSGAGELERQAGGRQSGAFRFFE